MADDVDVVDVDLLIKSLEFLDLGAVENRPFIYEPELAVIVAALKAAKARRSFMTLSCPSKAGEYDRLSRECYHAEAEYAAAVSAKKEKVCG